MSSLCSGYNLVVDDVPSEGLAFINIFDSQISKARLTVTFTIGAIVRKLVHLESKVVLQQFDDGGGDVLNR